MARISVTSIRVSREQSNPYIVGSFQLADPQAYLNFTPGRAFSLHLGGVEYSLVADSAEVSRQSQIARGGQTQQFASLVVGHSPVALLGPPFAATISKIYDTNMMAKDIVEDLLGQSVTWECLDWSIPANRFGVDNVTPLEAATQIAGAIKAVINSNPDGSLVVRSLRPVKNTSFNTTPKVATFGAGGALSVRASLRAQKSYNRVIFLAGASDQETNDSMDFNPNPDNGLTGHVRVYLNPWRTSPGLSVTRAGVSLSGGVTRIRTETADVEFKEGAGQVPFNVNSVQSVKWLDANLGGLVWDGSTTLRSSIAGNSYAEVVYSVRSLDFPTTAISPRKAQFVLEDF